MSSTRVLMFCNQFRPIVGGAERQAERLAHALRERGARVSVLTPRRDPAWPQREELDGLDVRRYPLPDLRRHLPIRGTGPANLVLHRLATRRAVREHLPDFDVLHAHLASYLVADAIAPAHALGRPVLCKVACGGERFDFRKIRNTIAFGGIFVRRLIDGIDGWIAVSSEVLEDLIAAGVPRARIVSIPNGVDLGDHPVRRIEAPVRRFLYLGRAAKCNFPCLIEAFDRLLAQVPDCELRIAGNGTRETLPDLLARFPRVGARTTLHDHLPAAEALDWTDAMVLPTRAEGLSNALLEGMARGLPCIASDIPPNRDVVDGGSCGLLAPLDAPAAWATELLRLTRDRELAARLGAAARARVEAHYAIGRVADRCLELYARIRRDPGANLSLDDAVPVEAA